MPLEDSGILEEVKVGEETELDKEFEKVLSDLEKIEEDKLLDKEQKFTAILKSTNNLIKFAGNKFVYFLKTSNHNKLSYVGIDDYSQDAKMMLWTIIEQNPDKPIKDLLRIFKTALWRITAYYFRRSYLKKNVGTSIQVTPFEDQDGSSALFDNLIYKSGETRDVNHVIEKIDFEDLKKDFLDYLLNSELTDENDAKIFKLISYPPGEFISFCNESNNSKKKKHLEFINQSNLASYLNVSTSYIHNRLKKLARVYILFKEERDGSGREV